MQFELFPNESHQHVIHGDCLEEMRKMENESIDCIVTDPPYGLSFMGKKWDKEVPSVEYWKEMLRIAKPGSFLLAAGAPRSHHHLAMAIENAGWEITDCIMHLFGSGFPKGKSSLKPAYEPWILARKKANKRQHLNIDECRIGIEGATKRSHQEPYPKDENGIENRDRWCRIGHTVVKLQLGRWPTNIILGDEEVEEMLDEQSGISKSCGGKSGNENAYGGWGKENHYGNKKSGKGDFGGASRFFYCAKASRSERNEGNKHPCVKPQKLMEYLIKLVTPKHEGAMLLDPFCGSGSTLIAARNLGFNAIGIEKELEYCEIARKRIENFNK